MVGREIENFYKSSEINILKAKRKRNFFSSQKVLQFLLTILFLLESIYPLLQQNNSFDFQMNEGTLKIENKHFNLSII